MHNVRNIKIYLLNLMRIKSKKSWKKIKNLVFRPKISKKNCVSIYKNGSTTTNLVGKTIIKYETLVLSLLARFGGNHFYWVGQNYSGNDILVEIVSCFGKLKIFFTNKLNLFIVYFRYTIIHNKYSSHKGLRIFDSFFFPLSSLK